VLPEPRCYLNHAWIRMRSVRSATRSLRCATRRRHDGGNARPVGSPVGDHRSAAPARPDRDDRRRYRCVPARHRRADAGASAELARQDAVRDRPVRAEGRQGAGLCRSLFRASGWRAHPARGAGRQRSRTLVQEMGVAAIAEYRRRRPPERMRVAVPAGGGRAQALDYIAWLKLRGSDINHGRCDHRRSEAIGDGLGRHPRTGRGATTKLEPLRHHLARFDGRSRPTRSRRCPMSPGS